MLLHECRKLVNGPAALQKRVLPKRLTREEIQDRLYKKPEEFRCAMVRTYLSCMSGLRPVFGQIDRRQLKSAVYEQMVHLFPNVRVQFKNKSE